MAEAVETDGLTVDAPQRRERLNHCASQAALGGRRLIKSVESGRYGLSLHWLHQVEGGSEYCRIAFISQDGGNGNTRRQQGSNFTNLAAHRLVARRTGMKRSAPQNELVVTPPVAQHPILRTS